MKSLEDMGKELSRLSLIDPVIHRDLMIEQITGERERALITIMVP